MSNKARREHNETMREIVQRRLDFCLYKCAEGYCSAMSGKGGYPCMEYICLFCDRKDDGRHCAFCAGVEEELGFD